MSIIIWFFFSFYHFTFGALGERNADVDVDVDADVDVVSRGRA